VHAAFCDLSPDRVEHGRYCVSRPIAAAGGRLE
jgi:hypothetical protein